MKALQFGQLAKMDGSDRLCIPVDVLRAIEWWDDKPVDVFVELVQAGLIRIYLGGEARPMVEALIENMTGLPPNIRFERMAILSDRYRPLKLYADGRLRLTKETTQILGFSLGSRTTLFVSPFRKGLEIMSLSFREERLEKNLESTSILLHESGLD
jgi:hypothetical protein